MHHVSDHKKTSKGIFWNEVYQILSLLNSLFDFFYQIFLYQLWHCLKNCSFLKIKIFFEKVLGETSLIKLLLIMSLNSNKSLWPIVEGNFGQYHLVVIHVVSMLIAITGNFIITYTILKSTTLWAQHSFQFLASVSTADFSLEYWANHWW